MENPWHVIDGTDWIAIPNFGRLSPRRDSFDGGRQYFTAKTDADEFAEVTGKSITGGPETWHFEFDEPFWMADRSGQVLEVQISLLAGGRYAVKYRQGEWPSEAVGGWV